MLACAVFGVFQMYAAQQGIMPFPCNDKSERAQPQVDVLLGTCYVKHMKKTAQRCTHLQ